MGDTVKDEVPYINLIYKYDRKTVNIHVQLYSQ